MLRRSLNILFSKTLSTFPSRSIFQTETLLLPISPKPSFRNVSVHSVRRFSKTSSPSTRNPLSRQDHVHWNWIPWWFWNQNGLYHELKTIGSRLRYQALESYGLWNGPLINVCFLQNALVERFERFRAFVERYGLQNDGCWSQACYEIRGIGYRALLRV